MTTAQRDNIGSPAEGLLIYNTDCKSFNFYNGTAWVSMSGSSSLANPGTITGNTNVCSGATGEVYSITAVTGATDYVWTIPTGATITAGQGTTSITVTFGANSGDICVQASDACFTSNTSCNSITVGTALNLNQLVAYYKFNEASGNIINEATNVGSVDAIPNSNLTVAGATYGATGQLGNALSFDGVNDHADANGSLITDWNFLHQNNAAWTIAFWVQYDNFTTPNDLFATTNGNTGDVGLVIRTRADRTILFSVRDKEGLIDTDGVTAALVP